MQPDVEKYRHHLARFDMTEAQKDEFIRALWTMLEGVVDRAFGTHPLQQAVDKIASRDSGEASLRLKFEDANNNN